MTAQALLALLEGWIGARWLQQSGTAYLVVNAAHVLGVGLLIGGILPLDLRLLLRRRLDALPVLAPAAIGCARTGLVLALVTGLWLFTVQPGEYLRNPAFLAKLVLLALALLDVVLQHRALRRSGAWTFAGGVPLQVRVFAAASMVLWLGTLLAGRWIGFV